MRNSAKQVFKGGWDKTASAVHTENILDGLVDIGGFFIKPDGTMLFLELINTIQAYDLSVPWDIFSAGPIIASFPITDDSNALGLSFSSDGTIMIVVGENTKILYSYVLPTPWDITSIVAAPTTMSLAVMLSTVYNCAFSRDGDYVFVNDIVDIHSFPLPIAYDITSNVTSTSSTLGLAVFGGFTFKPEGNRMYVVDLFNETIHEFELSIINDITTATPTGNILSIFLIIGGNTLISRPNGNEFFATSIGSGEIKKLSMTNSWDIPNASYFTNKFDVGTANLRDITWKPDGTKMYILDRVDELIYQYNAPNPFNLNGVTVDSTFPLAGIEPDANGMQWRLDGTRCYIIGRFANRLFQFNCGTPWDVSTMTDSLIFVDPSEANSTLGMFMRQDGLMLWLSDTNQNIDEYTMSTPWDITTLTYTGNTISTSPRNDPQSLCFNYDGTMMYTVHGSPSDVLARYVVSDPFNILSAVFADELAIDVDNSPGAIAFTYNAKKIFITGLQTDTIYCYDVVA